ncbi:MAG: SipW-dependent-type signal peptide-containing protein [Clostridia bacterium]|nr:SipW-dependent-type signal peptide-containing protein [Clostridia bacterium]
MKSTNRKRALLVSASVILLCLTVIVGMTWALFTDTVTVENHLKAGDLNITLERTKLETYSIDATTGYLASKTDNNVVNFSDPTGKNVFDLTANSKIVPCSYYTATMRISNNIAAVTENKQNSDVAYDYWIEVKLKVDGLTAQEIEALKLDEQLEITVSSEKLTTPMTAWLSNGLTVGSSSAPLGTLTLGDSDDFTVKMEFVSGASNNDAKTQNLTFDLIVHAVQRTTAP